MNADAHSSELPTRWAYIEVLWSMQGKDVWWKAIVQKIVPEPTITGSIIATGQLKYVEAYGYKESYEDVVFYSNHLVCRNDFRDVNKSSFWRPASIKTDAEEMDNGHVVVIPRPTKKQRKVSTHPAPQRSAGPSSIIAETVPPTVPEQTSIMLAIRLELRFRLLTIISREMTSFYPDDPDECNSFSDYLRRDTFTVSIPCDLFTFKAIVREAWESYRGPLRGSRTARDRNPNIKLEPSLSCLEQATRWSNRSTVVFKEFKSFASWLLVHDAGDLLHMLFKEVQLKSASAIRLLGGARWHEKNDAIPMEFFVGRSCSARRPFVKSSENVERVCLIKRETACWSSCSGFRDELLIGVGTPWGSNPSLNDVGNAFAVYWNARDIKLPASSPWSSDLEHYGDVVLGDVTVSVPYMTIIGENHCQEFKDTLAKIDIKALC